MPFYEFRCHKCDALFSELRSMGDFHPGTCPSCGSIETEKVFSVFFGGKANAKNCSTCSGKSSGRCASCH